MARLKLENIASEGIIFRGLLVSFNEFIRDVEGHKIITDSEFAKKRRTVLLFRFLRAN